MAGKPSKQKQLKKYYIRLADKKRDEELYNAEDALRNKSRYTCNELSELGDFFINHREEVGND